MNKLENKWSQEEKDLLFTWIQSNTTESIREALNSVRYILYSNKSFKAPFRSFTSVRAEYYKELNKRKKEGYTRRGKITPDIFREKLYVQNEFYRSKHFDLVSEYVRDGEAILIKNKYGILKVRARGLLKNGKPSITQAVDKSEYLMNEIKEINPDIIKQIVSLKYDRGKVYVETKYGVIVTKRAYILKTKTFSVKNAVNKTEYWLRMVEDKREDYINIDYSNTKYENSEIKSKFMCKIHKYEYEQDVYQHMVGKQGCPHCCKNIGGVVYSEENFEKHSEFLKNIHGFLYVIKLQSDEELFYKVGITRKKLLQQRLNAFKKFYTVTIEYAEKDLMTMNFKTEQTFLKDFNKFKYTPIKQFPGHTECLSVNPLDYYYEHYYENLENE